MITTFSGLFGSGHGWYDTVHEIMGLLQGDEDCFGSLLVSGEGVLLI